MAKKNILKIHFFRGDHLNPFRSQGLAPVGYFWFWGSPKSHCGAPPGGARSRGEPLARCLFSSSPVIKSFLKA